MIPITKAELNELKMAPNQAMVRCNEYDEYLFMGEEELMIDKSYEPNKHRQTYGRIVKTPPAVIGLKEVPIQVDDIVYFHFNTLGNCEADNRVFLVEENGVVELYYVILVQWFYVAKRGEQVFTLNGWILLEAIREGIISTGGIAENFEKSIKGEFMDKEGVIRYAPEDYDKITIGSRVYFGGNSDVPLQYPLHNNLDDDTMFFRMREDDIYFEIVE